MLLYEDDTVLPAQDQISLQKCCDDIMEFCQKWKLNVNTDKIKAVVLWETRTINNLTSQLLHTLQTL